MRDDRLYMDRESAQNLYFQLASLPGERLGPRCIDAAADRAFDQEISKACMDVVRRGDRLTWVPTPWHAFLLMHKNIKWACEHDKNRPIYRGQCNSKWELEPSIDRSEKREFDIRALKRFCDLVKTWLGTHGIPEVSDDSLVAAAQHYGIPTRLLDFTADPAVAIFFACHNSTAPSVTVFQLPLLQALDLGAKILFPPPFTKRLYVQRGIFVDCAASSSDRLRKESRRIEFPPDPEFRVIREGTEVELLGECAMEDSFLEEARRVAYSCEADEFGKHTELQVSGIGGPTYGRPSRLTDLTDLQEWIELVSEMLYWLAIAPTSDGQRCHVDVLGHIVRNNGPLMKHFADQCRVSASELERQGETEKAAGHRSLADLVIDQFRQQ